MVLVLILIVFLLVLGWIAWVFIDLRRQHREGWVECALRSPDQPLQGIGAKWRHGSAKAAPGVLTFRSGGPGGVRYPRGAPIDIPVMRARELPGERPAMRQAWSIDPTLRIAVADTAGGKLDIAAPTEGLTRLVSDLSATAKDAGPQ